MTEYNKWGTGEKTGEFKKTFTSLTLPELVDKCLVIVRAKAGSGRSIKDRLTFNTISAGDFDTIATGGEPGTKINKIKNNTTSIARGNLTSPTLLFILNFDHLKIVPGITIVNRINKLTPGLQRPAE